MLGIPNVTGIWVIGLSIAFALFKLDQHPVLPVIAIFIVVRVCFEAAKSHQNQKYDSPLVGGLKILYFDVLYTGYVLWDKHVDVEWRKKKGKSFAKYVRGLYKWLKRSFQQFRK